MPFRATFDCLWCGTAHTCRGSDDIEGWAQLCPTCIGKAGDNGFLRFRLRDAITERGRAGVPVPAGTRPAAANAAAMTTWSRTTRRAHPNTTTGTCAGVATNAARSMTPPGTPSSTRGAMARRTADLGADRRARGRYRLVVAAARRQGRAIDLRRGRGAAGPRPGPAARPWAPRPHPHTRRVGRAGSDGRCPVRRLLAEPRRALAPARVPGARASLAPSGRHVRVHRFAARSAIGSGEPPDARRRPLDPAARRRPRVRDRQGLLRAGRARVRAARGRICGSAEVSTTGRFFVLGRATA